MGPIGYAVSSDRSEQAHCVASAAGVPAAYATSVVLEKSTVEKLASALSLVVHSLPEEDHHDTDDASPGEISSLLVSASTMGPGQSPRRRAHRAALRDRHVQAPRTVALSPLPPGGRRAGGPLDGAEHAAGSARGTALAVSARGHLGRRPHGERCRRPQDRVWLAASGAPACPAPSPAGGLGCGRSVEGCLRGSLLFSRTTPQL